MKSLSCVRLFATPWTAACQAPPPMGFSRQEYWSGVPLPSLEEPYRCLNTNSYPIHHLVPVLYSRIKAVVLSRPWVLILQYRWGLRSRTKQWQDGGFFPLSTVHPKTTSVPSCFSRLSTISLITSSMTSFLFSCLAFRPTINNRHGKKTTCLNYRKVAGRHKLQESQFSVFMSREYDCSLLCSSGWLMIIQTQEK